MDLAEITNPTIDVGTPQQAVAEWARDYQIGVVGPAVEEAPGVEVPTVVVSIISDNFPTADQSDDLKQRLALPLGVCEVNLRLFRNSPA